LIQELFRCPIPLEWRRC